MKRGFTVVEMLFALTIGLVLLSMFGVLVSGAVGLLSRFMDRADAVHTRSLTRHVLAAELRAGLPEDHLLLGQGRIGMRVFRASSLVCPTTDARELVVWTRGDRVPDPVKDSILVLQRNGKWIAVGLDSRSARGSECPEAAAGPEPPSRGSGEMERWSLSAPVTDPVLARVFESGVYSVDDDALRYRRGRGGAQPLTPPMLERGAARIARDHRGLALQMTTKPGRGDTIGSTRYFLFRWRRPY